MTSVCAQTTKMPVKVSLTPNADGEWKVKIVLPLLVTNSKKCQGKKRKTVRWPEEPTQKVGYAIETERIKISCNGTDQHWTCFVRDTEIHKDTEANTRDNESKSLEKSAMIEKQKSFTMCGGKKSLAEIAMMQLENYEKFHDPIGFLSAHFVQTAASKRNLENYTTDTIQECVDLLEFKKGCVVERGSAMICWPRTEAAYINVIPALDKTITHLKGYLTAKLSESVDK